MSPHRPFIFLQHSRSAAVIAALGTAHTITGNFGREQSRQSENSDFLHKFQRH